MKIHILVCDGVFDLGLAALTDTVGLANAMSGSLPQAPAHIELTLVGVRRRIRTAQGLTVPVVTARGVPEPDVVLVPAFGEKMPDTLSARLTRPDVPDAVAVLQQWSAAGAHLGAACSGSFLLAESGLLDGHRATTSWWLGPMFRQRYPNVTLDESRMIVNSTRFTTAGAALAHVDLALRIIRGRSPALAALVARYLLVEARSSQAEFVIPDHLAHADPMVERFECWARSRLAKGFSLAEAASAAGTSERTLARRLQSVFGQDTAVVFPGPARGACRPSLAHRKRQRRSGRRTGRVFGWGDPASPVAPQAGPGCQGVATRWMTRGVWCMYSWRPPGN
ncbi:AraC family transcriptional regulator [Pseudomonas aeruginosa]|nr:AraC family transcriptional regulator [Pseudomonas aeruginosa]